MPARCPEASSCACPAPAAPSPLPHSQGHASSTTSAGLCKNTCGFFSDLKTRRYFPASAMKASSQKQLGGSAGHTVTPNQHRLVMITGFLTGLPLSVNPPLLTLHTQEIKWAGMQNNFADFAETASSSHNFNSRNLVAHTLTGLPKSCRIHAWSDDPRVVTPRH